MRWSKLILGFLTLAGIVLLVAACRNPFTPAVVGPSQLVPIALQTSPDSVLANFKYAYEQRDIDVYENCLDEEFIFRYIDQDRTGQIEQVEIPLRGPSGDLERTRRLFQLFDEIRLDTWVPIFEREEQVGEETWQVWRVYFNLSVKDINGDYGYEFLEAVGIAEFKFRRSQSDDLYRIVFWDDKSYQ